jgi:hypothetical protein
MVIRTELLTQADSIINGQRNELYGKPKDSFKLIAEYWSTYLQYPVTSVDVALMMTLLKVARLAETPTHHDSYVDILGYTALAGEMALTGDEG